MTKLPLQKANALVYEKGKSDFRIKWTGPDGDAESGVPYATREKATLMAISLGPEKVGQDYGRN